MFCPFQITSIPVNWPQSRTKWQSWPHWAQTHHNPEPLESHNIIDKFMDFEGIASRRPKNDEYLYRDGSGYWWRHKCELGLRMRSARRNRFMPKNRSDADLFTVERIPANTLFITDIIAKEEHTADLLWFTDAFKPWLNHSRSVGIGRGRAPVYLVHHDFDPLPLPAKEADSVLRLTMSSDWIVRGDNLGSLTELNRNNLLKLLGENPDEWSSLELGQQSADHETQGGFNIASGLQRPPTLVIRRGTTCDLIGSDTWRLREKLKAVGALGERTKEGYGRFILDCYPHRELGETKPDNRLPIPDADQEIGIRESILNRAKNYADSLKINDNDLPSNQQLHQLLSSVVRQKDCNIKAIVERFEAAAKKKGGEKWKQLVTDNKNSGLKSELDAIAKLTTNNALCHTLFHDYVTALIQYVTRKRNKPKRYLITFMSKLFPRVTCIIGKNNWFPRFSMGTHIGVLLAPVCITTLELGNESKR